MVHATDMELYIMRMETYIRLIIHSFDRRYEAVLCAVTYYMHVGSDQ